jgi:TolB protein
MKKLHRFALAIALVPLVSVLATGRSPSAEAAGCTKDDDCDDGNPCTKDKCDQAAGQCESKPHDQGNHFGQPVACDDGNACTSGDACHAGLCAGLDVPDGSACNDGDACTRSDSCQTGVCTGANPVVCSASDQCHEAGTCDPATGACSDPAAPDGTACDDLVTCSGQDTCQAGVCSVPGAVVQKIAFASTRDNPPTVPQALGADLYLMDPDGAHLLRLTKDDAFSDLFPALSPDGKGRIVFDSSRSTAADEPPNLVDLFLMRHDGSNPQHLVRGSSASWSPDSQTIAFQRSASGTGLPIHGLPGAPAADSDIFVARVCDLLAGEPPTNITNDPATIDSDPDWSSDGRKIVFQNTDVADHPTAPTSADLWVINPDGSGLTQLTNSAEEERAPAWSPDGMRIVFMCRRGPPAAGMVIPSFEICVMDADGTDQIRLTFNNLNDASPKFSPDGQKIVWHRASGGGAGSHIWVMKPDGSGQTQITFPATGTDPPTGTNLFPDWGFVTQ